MRGAHSLAVGKPAAGLRVRGRRPPEPLVGEGRTPSQQYGGVNYGCVSSDGGSVGVLALGSNLLQTPGLCNYPWHKIRAKALLSSCLANDDYALASFTSLEVSLKSPRAWCCSFLFFWGIVVMPPFHPCAGAFVVFSY